MGVITLGHLVQVLLLEVNLSIVPAEGTAVGLTTEVAVRMVPDMVADGAENIRNINTDIETHLIVALMTAEQVVGGKNTENTNHDIGAMEARGVIVKVTRIIQATGRMRVEEDEERKRNTEEEDILLITAEVMLVAVSESCYSGSALPRPPPC